MHHICQLNKKFLFEINETLYMTISNLKCNKSL